MEITNTDFGTTIVDGIEYNDYPPPAELIKAMERQWAVPLDQAGSIKMRKLAFYQCWEKRILGDPEDGKGFLRFDGRLIHTGTVNDVYAWCTSLSSIQPSRLALIARDGGYDCLVRIREPSSFLARILSFLRQNYQGFRVHCGHVVYNRRADVDKITLNSQSWHFNVFQKAQESKDDEEYRISIVNCTFNHLSGEDLDLELGDCSDIITIEELPDHTPDGIRR